MSLADTVLEAFPEIDEISDKNLRDSVIDAWTSTLEETGVDDLSTLQWSPKTQRELGLPEARLVDHIRDTTIGAFELADLLIERRGVELSRDVVVAGALLHDISKLYEYDEDAASGHTALGDLLVHPHYGVHVCARAGIPVEVTHAVLAHSKNTGVEPATLEAEIVSKADEVAAAAIRMEALSDLRDA